ncbi:MAG: DUF6054 family protein [Bacillota bacterium]
MKLRVQKDLKTLKDLIHNYYNDYDIIYAEYVNQETYFMVVEKFFLRNSSRASLSILMIENDIALTTIHAIGSGGGQGMFFKFDWGAKESFENAIPKILSSNNISFNTL